MQKNSDDDGADGDGNDVGRDDVWDAETDTIAPTEAQ